MRGQNAGMTLIELMVAMAIGVFLTWGAIQVYLQSKSNYRMAEVVARLQENVRFALETMEPDIRLAGFWGQHNEPSLVEIPAGMSVSCDGIDVSAEMLDLAAAIDGSDDGYNLPCAPFSEARAGSDVLIVRHASGQPVLLQAGQLQLQSSLAGARLFDDGLLPAGYDAATSGTHDLQIHAYYIDNSSSFDAGSPSLRRLTLVNGAVMQDQEIIAGAENLQVQFGLDTNGDNAVDRFVDRDQPALIPGAVGYVPGARVVALRIWLLVRADAPPDPGFSDEREYQPLDADLGPITPADPLYPPRYPRVQVSKTVFLRNLTS